MVLLLCIALSCVGSLIFVVADSPQRTLPQASRAWIRSRARGLSDNTNITGRLATLKKGTSFEDFKTEQLINSATVFTISIALLTAVTESFAVAFILSCALASGTYFLIDKSLSFAIEKNRQQL